jgi:DNA-binding beta-propeller fold protein YncE
MIRTALHYHSSMKRAVLFCAVITLLAGCGSPSKPDAVWGERGSVPGQVVRPRAATIIGETLYLVDFTARIQAFTLDGQHTGLTFTTPDFRNGRPSGLGVDRAGNLVVADSHYHCVRIYDTAGKELKVFGGQSGREPGQFGYVSDCVQDAEGFYYISEFGVNDRITKLDAEGKFVKCWGKSGTEPGELLRVRSLALGPDGLLYCADACNHRIQVFDRNGQFIRTFGGPGSGEGEFNYPYDLAFNDNGELYVVERGNCRVQKLTREGQYLGHFGSPGRGAGQLADPWAIAVDKRGRVHIVDTENHRVQRVRF